MNTHAFTLPRVPLPNAPYRAEWFRRSGIASCATCDGEGRYWNGRGLGGNDPDSWMIDCADCCGTGQFNCEVCGFSTPVSGYDCLVCTMNYELTAEQREKIDPAELAASFTRSIAAAKKEAV